MSESLRQWLERRVEEADERMTLMQKREYQAPPINVIHQSPPAPRPQAAIAAAT